MFWIITTNSSHVSIWNTILWGISGICQTTTKNESEEWHWVTKKFWYFFHVWLNRKGWAFFICFCIELLEKCYFVWTTQRKPASRIRKGSSTLEVLPRPSLRTALFVQQTLYNVDSTATPAPHKLTDESGGPGAGRQELPALPEGNKGAIIHRECDSNKNFFSSSRF